MAITIRNKETEDLIRKIGRRTGEGPSAVVRRLAEKEATAPNATSVSPAEFERRMQVFEDLRRKYPPAEPKLTWAEVEREMDALFDYLDEEPSRPSTPE